MLSDRTPHPTSFSRTRAGKDSTRMKRLNMPIAAILAVIATASPALAQVAPPSPSPMGGYTTTPAIAQLNADFHPASPDRASCAGGNLLALGVLGALVLNAGVVSNAVRHGATGRTAFGSARSSLPYIVEGYAVDLAGAYLLRNAGCRAQHTFAFAVGASALYNAAASGVRP